MSQPNEPAAANPDPPARVLASYDELSRALSMVNLESVGEASPLAGLTGAVAGPDVQDTADAEPEPADPVDLARFQAALGQAVDALQAERATPGVMHTAQNPLASMMQTLLAERAAQTGNVERTVAGALEAKFDTRDLVGWFRSLFEWWRKVAPAEFLPPPGEPDPFPSDARMALMGDWGTGMYGAPVITRTLEALPAAERPGLLVHLGDVYYAGAPKEMTARFLDLWPKIPGAVSRGCNGNHEMYSGGIPFFGQVLPSFRQTSSCWALRNDHWLLVGLDSAYDDHALHGGQAAWLTRLVDAAGDRRVILFCHHQPFSAFESQGPKLVAALRPLLYDRRIFAWYWGHEHRCTLYDVHPGWGLLGRCVGHGGMPYFRDRGDSLARPGWLPVTARAGLPGGKVLGGPNPYLEGEAEKYGPNGYAVLEFSGPCLLERMLLPDGTVLAETELA